MFKTALSLTTVHYCLLYNVCLMRRYSIRMSHLNNSNPEHQLIQLNDQKLRKNLGECFGLAAFILHQPIAPLYCF